MRLLKASLIQEKIKIIGKQTPWLRDRMINWQYYPKSDLVPVELKNIVDVFIERQHDISSELFQFNSDAVLAILRPGLVELGFDVEKGKKQVDKVRVPVLFGRNGEPELTFEADAAKPDSHIVLEVEAGRAVSNFQFLKDLFEACMMQNILFAGIAVRNEYRYGKSRRRDFDYVTRFLDTLYASGRLTLPLQGILVIGY